MSSSDGVLDEIVRAKSNDRRDLTSLNIRRHNLFNLSLSFFIIIIMSTDNEETVTTITATTHLTLPAHPTPMTYEQLNPRSRPTEFFGPPGTFLVSTLCPFVAYFLFYACNEHTGCHPTSGDAWREVWEGMLGQWYTSKGRLWDWDAVIVYLGWYTFCVVCWAVLPGEKVQGTLMRDGRRKTYTMNGEPDSLP